MAAKQERIDWAVRLWEEGQSMSQIGASLGISREAVSGMIHRNRERFAPRAPTKSNSSAIRKKKQKPLAKQEPEYQTITGIGETLKSEWRANTKIPRKCFFYYGMELSPRFTFVRLDREETWQGHGIRAVTLRQLNAWVNKQDPNKKEQRSGL